MELQEKRAEMDRLKQEFVSMASHQLRTPMAVFAANLEMLAETEEAKSPLMKRILARMERESTRMVRLVDDVLAVSRLNTEEELQVNKTPIEIVSFLREIVADEAFYFDEVPIALHTELQQGTVEADEEQLTHILHNLLSNAIKYSERRDPPEVHVRQTAAGKIQVDLKDHGVGIPEADLPKLFQQFHRASNVKKIAGTGLGLYIAKRFAEANAIEIEVDSKEDIGTTFSLTFNQTGHAQTH
jgi:signal transduction histidine kinase